ncbi:MAG: flavodoxin family protein, partial [Acidimicrobiaceae bacterium]|nr:flavodoxin family protein [Acidimicrobiaceae bacterium]
MKTLVVQAHPLAQSFSTALLHRICQALQASGTDHDVMRLPQDEEPDLSY